MLHLSCKRIGGAVVFPPLSQIEGTEGLGKRGKRRIAVSS
jgi:hypothetical protein